MKRVILLSAGLTVLAGTIATAFARSSTVGPATMAVLMGAPDSLAFFAVGIGLLALARRRDRAQRQ